jgi:hypothetical protein
MQGDTKLSYEITLPFHILFLPKNSAILVADRT